MNILILSGSPRKGGNTELLAEAFAKGAAEHHHVEIVSLIRVNKSNCIIYRNEAVTQGVVIHVIPPLG